MEEVVKWLKALVFLQLRADDGTVKQELLLHKAGLSNPEIAELLGKTPNTVSKVISRAKQAKAGSVNE